MGILEGLGVLQVQRGGRLPTLVSEEQKNAETIKANKTNSCWSNEEAVCRHWCPKGDGSVWADHTDGMTVSKSTLIKTPYSIACLISLVSRPKKCGNNQTIKQTDKLLYSLAS